MDSFAMNLTLMQATIIEQQITNFVLENEYQKQLGIVTEDSKLKAAWQWIKEKIDRFIEIVKTWFGKIINFLTKTFPQWVAKRKKSFIKIIAYSSKISKSR